MVSDYSRTPEAPVSVVIPCYNNSATLERAVESVLAQTVQPREIFLVDDASTDTTPEVIHKLKTPHPELISSIHLKTNQGPSSARNAGWDRATQPFVAFLDADDSWLPQKLEIQWGWMKDHPEVHLSGHALILKNTHPKNYGDNDWQKVTPRHLLIRNEFSPCGIMLKHDIPLRFPEEQRFMEDQWFILKAAFSGLNLYKSDQPLAVVYKPRYGTDGLSGNLWLMERGELSNLGRLRRDGYLSIPEYVGASGWSLLKFARRLTHAGWRRAVGKQETDVRN